MYNFKILLDLGFGDTGYLDITNQVETGVSENFVLSEELDTLTFTIPFTTQKDPYYMNNLLYVENQETESENRTYLIINDDIDIVSFKRGIYSHKINAIELTKALEKVIPSTLTFTQPLKYGLTKYTLWDCLERIRKCSVFEKNVNGTDYAPFDSVLVKYKDFLNSIPAPQFVLTNMNCREMINEILKAVNGTARLVTSDYEPTKKLAITLFNERGQLVDIETTEQYNANLSGEIFGSQAVSNIENAIFENGSQFDTISYPTFNDYATPRPKDYSLSESDITLNVDTPIYALQKVYINAQVDITVIDSEQVATTTTENFKIDISDRVLDYEAWKVLSTKKETNSNELIQNNTLYYKKNSIYIENIQGSLKVLFWDYAVLNQVVIQTSKYYADNNIAPFNIENAKTYVIDGYGKISKLIEQGYESDTFINNTTKASLDLDKIFYQVEYIPTLSGAKMITNKKDLTEHKVQTQMELNQTGRVISISNLGANLVGKIERLGNTRINFTLRHENVENAFKLGDYTDDNFVVSNVLLTYYDSFILAKYELEKNFNVLNEFIEVNSEYRSFDISQDKNTYARNLYYNEFIMLSTNGFLQNTSMCKISTVNEMLKLFNPNQTLTENKQVSAVLFYAEQMQDTWLSYTDLYDIPCLLLSCNSIGAGDNLIFNFGFDTNVYAGKVIDEDNADLKYLAQQVPYCLLSGLTDEEIINAGTLETFSFKLLNNNFSLPNASADNVNAVLNYLPITNYKDENGEYLNNDERSYNNPTKFYVDKDNREILSMSYNLSILPQNSQDIVIGKYFIEKNPLVFFANQKTINKVYVSDSVYSQFDNIAPKDYTTYEIDSLENDWLTVETDTYGGVDRNFLQLGSNTLDFLKQGKSVCFGVNTIFNLTIKNEVVLAINPSILNNYENVETLSSINIYFNLLEKRNNLLYN